MRLSPFFALSALGLTLSLTLSLTSTARAQTPIEAPAGWRVQTKPGGATQFTPPNLAAGEVYSLTIYDSAPLQGATLEAYLRRFAGPVGKAPGQLAAPLKLEVSQGRIVSGTGVYIGPQNTQLIGMFVGVSLDGGANIHIERTLFSAQGDLLTRYKTANEAVLSSLVKRAKGEAGDNLEVTPDVLTQKFKSVGGPMVPGIYAGNQLHGEELRHRFHVHIFPNGEYRITDQDDADLVDRWGDAKNGKIRYNANSGKLEIDWTIGLGNNYEPGQIFCYFGRDAAGKPGIYAEDNIGYTLVTSLSYIGPPNKIASQSQVEAQKAAAEAEKNRFKWVTAPGRGVPNAQIAAVLCNSVLIGNNTNTDVYLLLKDGSIYADLPVAPDELDAQKSKQKEPDKWGKWRRGVKGDYLVSWNGAKYENLPGFAVVPAPSQTKLQGRWGTGTSSGVIGFSSSFALWGVSFDRAGRFKKDRRGGSSSTMGFGDNATNVNSAYDDEGSFAGGSGPNFVVGSSTKKNPNGSREGSYSLSGYVLTLRYDNGKVARLPFFFFDKDLKSIYFEGSMMSKD